jgi:hypothetical protein
MVIRIPTNDPFDNRQKLHCADEYRLTRRVKSNQNEMYSNVRLLRRFTLKSLMIMIMILYMNNYRNVTRRLFQGIEEEVLYLIMSKQTNHSSETNNNLSDEEKVPTTFDTLSIIYNFPIKPLYVVTSILNESIGPRILNNPEENPLSTCSPTVQFRLTLPSTFSTNVNNETVWTLQSMMIQRSNSTINSTNKSLTELVVPKPYGGDEIYVEWESNTDMGVAQITDMLDGTYQLKFIRPPLVQYNYTKNIDDDNNKSDGRLTIYYDYTCGIGSIFPPGKDNYGRAGEIHVSFTNWNVPQPFIHEFIPPNSINNIQDDTSIIDLSKYHTVISFGDSLMLQLVRQYTLGGYWSSNIIYEKNIVQCISNRTEADEVVEKFHTFHNDQIIHAAKQNRSIAVIAGSSVWDITMGCVRTDFIDHRTAVSQFIGTIRTRYPQIDLYWKSPSALVLHRRNSLKELLDPTWLQRSRYVSDTLPRKLYQVQKSLMIELNVPFLDLYEAYYLSGPWSRPGDCRHYQDEISSLLLSYYWPGLNRTTVYYLRDSKDKIKRINETSQ